MMTTTGYDFGGYFADEHEGRAVRPPPRGPSSNNDISF